MCGIAGVIRGPRAGVPFDALETVRAMAGTLIHRGPDDEGAWAAADGSVALAHRRLSIVDLSPLGRNPMAYDGGRLQLTFNGEIYNYLELRAELERAGHRFRSRTDTEVVLAAYDEWGTEGIHRFAGMFAFGLWDAARRRLWLARDRVGKKPLYYTTGQPHFAFASELKALRLAPAVAGDIDRTALGLYLRYGYVPAPRTIYAAARKLPPGHDALWENGELRVQQYWDPLQAVQSPRDLSDAEAEGELEERLQLAVAQRRVADVPLGAFLSGGIDSSLIVALMQEQSQSPVQTFTIRFESPEFDEADAAAAVAAHLRTDHHEEMCDEHRLLDAVEQLPAMYDEPFADSSAIPTLLVSQVARRRVTVALSGDGGDELFVGYPRYVHFADRSWVLDIPRPVRHAAAGLAARLPTRRLRRIADVLADDDDDRYARFVAWRTGEQVRELLGEDPGDAEFYAGMRAQLGARPAAERPPLLDLVSYLPDDILTKVDRASMAVGLEVRSPLLDHRVVELALALPMRVKRRGRTTKWLLRRLLDRRVPASLVERPKMGFGVPLADWFRSSLRERMTDYCAGPDLEGLGIDPAPIVRQWDAFLAGRPVRADLLWQIFALVAWSRQPRPAPLCA